MGEVPYAYVDSLKGLAAWADFVSCAALSRPERRLRPCLEYAASAHPSMHHGGESDEAAVNLVNAA